MSAKTVFFFILSVTLLVTLSIVLNFWPYLLIISVLTIVILCLIGHHYEKREEEERFARSFGRSEFTRNPENKQERSLRNKIETEWDNYSAFGNSEDLR